MYSLSLKSWLMFACTVISLSIKVGEMWYVHENINCCTYSNKQFNVRLAHFSATKKRVKYIHAHKNYYT